jgi:hypothetical protein
MGPLGKPEDNGLGERGRRGSIGMEKRRGNRREEEGGVSASVRWKWIAGFLAVLIFEFILWFWRQVVDPFPDFMYLEFFSSFQNYLSLSQHLGNDLFRLIEFSGLEDYPLGFFVYPWLISGLGLQEIFLEDPWLLGLFMTIPLALLPLCTRWNRGRTLAYFTLVFLFPGTQILLKSMNPQAPIVVYTLCSLGFLFSFLRQPRSYKLLVFFLFAWFAIAIKHLGAFYVAIIIFTLVLWKFLRRESLRLELILSLALFVTTLPIYYASQSLEYLIYVIRVHNPFFTEWAYLGLAVLVLALNILGFWILRQRTGSRRVPRVFQGLGVIFASMFFWQVVLFVELNDMATHIASGVCLLATLWACVFVVRKYDVTSVETLKLLLAINLLGYTSVLYLTLVGHTSSIFLLPVVLILYLWIEQAQGWKKGAVLGVLFLVYSNFFPSQEFFEKTFNDDEVYRRMFNTERQNPLGWARSDITQARRDLIKILESYEYKERHYEQRLKIGCVGMDLESFGFHVNYELYFPEIESSEILPAEITSTAYESIEKFHKNSKVSGELLVFHQWVDQALLPVLIYKEPEEPKSPRLVMERAMDELMEREAGTFEMEEIDDEIVEIFVPYVLWTPSLKKIYEFHEFSFGKDRYHVLVHSSLAKRRSLPTGPNYYLTKDLKERVYGGEEEEVEEAEEL